MRAVLALIFLAWSGLSSFARRGASACSWKMNGISESRQHPFSLGL
jgi:hypothetical protein